MKYISERDSASMDPESRDELSQLVRFIVATNKRSGHLKLNHAYRTTCSYLSKCLPCAMYMNSLPDQFILGICL